MTRPAHPQAWRPFRWAVVILGFFALEVLTFGRAAKWPRGGGPYRPQPLRATWLATGPQGGLAERQWLFGDPVVFARPDRRGFGGVASRALPRPSYDLAEYPAASSWLPLGGRLEVGRAPKTPATPIPWPKVAGGLPPSAPPLATASWIEWSGPRDDWKIVAPEPPAEIPADEVLPAVVVEVTVNAAGEVLAARLAGPRGNAVADDTSLRLATQVRFVGPTAPARGIEREQAAGSERLIFHWRTAPSLR